MRGRYIWDNRRRDWVLAEKYFAKRQAKQGLLIKDIEPYRSVRTGEVIGGRKQHRDHLRAYGLREVGNDYVAPRTESLSRTDRVQDIKRAMGE